MFFGSKPTFRMLSMTWSTSGSCAVSMRINPSVVGMSQTETEPGPT